MVKMLVDNYIEYDGADDNDNDDMTANDPDGNDDHIDDYQEQQ